MLNADTNIMCLHRYDFRGTILWVQDIPGNGDCLFGSIVHQLYGLHPIDNLDLFESSTLRLRKQVVAYLREHIHEFYHFLLPFAGDHDPEGTVMGFLDHLSKSGVWGGEETLYVICRKFNVNVEVWNSRSGRVLPYHCMDNVSVGTIRLLYTGVHYDSIVYVGDPPGYPNSGKLLLIQHSIIVDNSILDRFPI